MSKGGSGLKEEKIVQIAQKLGYAKSTVSRAVRHCGGVDAETRRIILNHMEKSDISAAKECDLYVILPDTPTYFWGKIYKEISSAAKSLGINPKMNLYTNLADSDLVLRYLEEALALEPKVLLIAAHVTPEIAEQLRRMSLSCAVIFLTEYNNIPNTFYFGADDFGDGFRMGQYFCEHFPDRVPIVLCCKELLSYRLRADGFMEALLQYNHKYASNIAEKDYPVDLIHTGKGQLAPSLLAQYLTECVGEQENTCLYITSGSAALPLALQKAKLKDKAVFLCHDIFLSEDGIPKTEFAASMNQDLPAQCKNAVKAAAVFIENQTFPDHKFTYTPSQMVFGK